MRSRALAFWLPFWVVLQMPRFCYAATVNGALLHSELLVAKCKLWCVRLHVCILVFRIRNRQD
jgi:hypothetical protein